MVSKKPSFSTLAAKIGYAAVLVMLGTIGGAYGDDALFGSRSDDIVCREVVASIRAEMGTYATREQVSRIDAQIDAIGVSMDRMTQEITLIGTRMWDARQAEQ